MYHIFTTFIAFASICLARPPLNNSSTPNVLPLGFPPGDLPPSDESRDMAGNLLLPLDPLQHTNVKQRFKFERAPTGPFKGSHLIYSISLSTLGCWKDNKNTPIRERKETRFQPYTEIFHIIRPALSPVIGALTPSRVGIVYCWMMKEVLLQPTWPGLVIADIYYAGDSLRPESPLGEIIIKNIPQANAASTLTPSTNSTSLEASIAPQGNMTFVTMSENNNVELPVLQDVASREKAWLDCFIRMMFRILRYPPSAHINEYMPQSTGGVLWSARSSIDPRQMAYVRFAPLTLDLTWFKLATAAISVCEKAARNDRWQNEESVRIFERGSIFIAEISFKRT